MKKRYTLEQKRWDSPAKHAMPEYTRVPASFIIGNVDIAPATVLAPMAGVTDTVFRRFIKNASQFSIEHSGHTNVETSQTNQQSGCGLIMTEFTSADGLSRMRESKRKRYLTYYDDEHPISSQIFGANPETLADSARICQDSGFDIVDLNLGCPAKRVVACNGGSGLLRDLPLIEVIFKRVRAAVSIPFTVKFRMGWNDHHIVCVELAKLAEDCGLNAVALHARTREDGYTGQARWEYIAAVKDAVKIPVIGNGDIRTPEDAAAMVDATHCDAVMIGRAAPANPWIFRQIAQYTASKEMSGIGSYDVPTDQDRYRMIRTYFQMLVDEIALEEQAEAARAAVITASGQTARDQRHRDCVGKMKQFASWFTHGVPGGSSLRKAIFEAKNGPAVLDSVEAFFAVKAEREADQRVRGRPRRYTRLSMKVSWRKNPKTPDGWFKRIAISLLAALAMFLLSLPVSFMAFLNHLESTDPNDSQIFLGALTSAVFVGLVIAAIFFVAAITLLTLLSLRNKPVTP